MQTMQLTTDELLACIIAAFSGPFWITDINTTDDPGHVSFSIDGHRLIVSHEGSVDTVVGGGVLVDDIPARLAGLVLRPRIRQAKDMKLAT